MSTLARPPAEGAARLIQQMRHRWAAEAVLHGGAWSVAAALGTAALLVGLDLAAPLPAGVRVVLRWLPTLLAAAGLAATLHRVWRGASPERLALLAQERLPGLENRLATALEDGPAGPVRDAFFADLARALPRRAPAAPPRVRLPLSITAGVLAGASAAAVLTPALAHEAAERWLNPRDAYAEAWRERRIEAVGQRASAPLPGLGELRWTIQPPAYTGLPALRGRGEEPAPAVAGSRLEVRGYLSARWDEVRVARAGAEPLAVRSRGGEWSVALGVAPGERGLTVEAVAGGEVVSRRSLPLVVRPDDPPEVALREPEADLVLARPAGRVRFAAAATDEFGVADLRLSWSRTRGSGEVFEYIDGEWALQGVRPGPQTSGSLTVDLGALGLQPGDVLHVRAVARDRNDVTGPGESVSRTRTLRIARPEELDEVNTDIGFPMELPENPVLSQRMIVMRTERLRDSARALGAREVGRRARDLAREQARLRERVGEQIFTRATGALQDPFAELGGYTETGGGAHAHAPGEDHAGATPEEVLEEASEATGRGTAEEVEHRHDEAPILDVNRTMQRIYDLMWSSERALNQAEPANSLPHQYEALRLIQELRRVERRFPRGVTRVDAVDVPAARGTGEIHDAAPAPRSRAAPLPDPAAALAELARAAAAVRGEPPAIASLRTAGLADRLLATPGVEPAAVALVSRAAEAAATADQDGALALLAEARRRLQPTAGLRSGGSPRTEDPVSAEYFRRLGRTP